MCQIPLANEPQNSFFFSGNSSGINVALNKQIEWSFQSVIALLIFIYIINQGIFYWNLVFFRRIKSFN